MTARPFDLSGSTEKDKFERDSLNIISGQYSAGAGEERQRIGIISECNILFRNAPTPNFQQE